jgi:general secretion pathway protein K
MMRWLRRREDERGMALVLVLLVLSVLTAMVVEFAYGIHVNTSLLTNWQRLQEISLAAESGVSVAAEGLRQSLKNYDYYNMREFAVPPMDPLGLGISVGITVIDEHSKFNLNTVVKQNGDKNEVYYKALERLLEALELDPVLAEAIKDYIDSDILGPWEGRAANAPMQSVEELLHVAGIDHEVYNTLSPYVTVYGDARKTWTINVNTAEWPVLMSLNRNMTKDVAQTVIEHRGESPFEKKSDFLDAPGLSSIKGEIDTNMLTVKGYTFGVISRAMDSDGLVREIRCMMNMSGNGTILYWREI